MNKVKHEFWQYNNFIVIYIFSNIVIVNHFGHDDHVKKTKTFTQDLNGWNLE